MSGPAGDGWAWWDQLADAYDDREAADLAARFLRSCQGDAGAFPLQPVDYRLVLTDLCGRYGPEGCICHLDKGHLGGAGGAEPEHDCGHCRWPDERSVSGHEADARLVATARANGVPEHEIQQTVRIGPVDGHGGVIVEIDLSDGGPL